jgi:hypothetical protein
MYVHGTTDQASVPLTNAGFKSRPSLPCSVVVLARYVPTLKSMWKAHSLG